MLMLVLIAVALAVRHTYCFFALVLALGAAVYISVRSRSFRVLAVVVIFAGLAWLRGAAVYLWPSGLEAYGGSTVTVTAQMLTYPEYGSGVSAGFKCLSVDGEHCRQRFQSGRV
jgi:hypothetical protein